MTINTFERSASIIEMAVEMDRRGAVIERLEAERDTLTAALAAEKARADGLADALRTIKAAYEDAKYRPGDSPSVPVRIASLMITLGNVLPQCALATIPAKPAGPSWPDGPYAFGDRVEKAKGSSWHGTVCGWYSTSLTPIGFNVESEREPGSVQLYPAAALIPAKPATVTFDADKVWDEGDRFEAPKAVPEEPKDQP